MTDALFDAKRAAQIIRRSLMRDLHELQQRIIIIERFGPHAVTYPQIQERPGSLQPREELYARHTELVDQIDRLSKALNAASEIEIEQFVKDLVARRRK